MALELVAGAALGTVFGTLYDVVKQAMGRTAMQFKPLLEDLKFTLDCLEPHIIQQIGDQNVGLNLPNQIIESLQRKMNEGKILVLKLSKHGMWNCYIWCTCCCCCNCTEPSYGDQLVELDRSLRVLLERLKLEETRNVQEALALARDNRTKQDELLRRQSEILKMLRAQHEARDVQVEGNTESVVREQTEGNGVQGAVLGAVFGVLFGAIIQVKDKTRMFMCILGYLKSTLHSLKPLIEEIAEYNTVLQLPKAELENFRIQMEMGVELVYKCSKVRPWARYKKYEYTNKLLALDQSLQKMLNILIAQIARDVRESVRESLDSASKLEMQIKQIEESKLEMEIKQIEESSVVQNQNQIEMVSKEGDDGKSLSEAVSAVGGLDEFPKGQSPSVNLTDNYSKLPSDFKEVLIAFTFSEVKKITANFSIDRMLGRGGFGSVYKGFITEDLREGSTPQLVTVKVYDGGNMFQGQREWLEDVLYLGQLSHPNLVKLIGYCCEDEHRLLILEFMSRGSLEQNLFSSSLTLPWFLRMKIAFGAAKGLAFLHEDSRQVICRDFKTSNILLDWDYNAKLCHIGLAKDIPVGDKSHVSTRIIGTYGYAAPEYVATGHLTSKSDVYGFGVVLLEMLTGLKAIDKSRPSGEHNFADWAFPMLKEKKKLLKIVDPKLGGDYPIEGVHKAAKIAYHCLNRNPRERPQMRDIVDTLECLQVQVKTNNRDYQVS